MATNHKEIAKAARIKVLEMIYRAQTSHIGSNFSVIDILTVLFEKVDLSKDKIILSAGWKAAAFYYFLAEKGVIPKEALDTYCQEESKYIGLTEPTVPGVHFAGGSMGLGMPAAIGFALAKKMSGEDGRVYVIMSDGEMQCGTTWESALIAAHHQLGNLTVVVDVNGLQAMGDTNKILSLCSTHQDGEFGLQYKLKTFGWCSWNIDGHDYRELDSLFSLDFLDFMVLKYPNISFQFTNKEKKNLIDMPKIFLASTIKGKGVPFMENNNLFHYKAPSEEEYQLAMKELCQK